MPVAYIISLSLLLFLIGLGWWLFFRKSKSPKRPFRPDWTNILNEKVRFYRELSLSEQRRFEQDILRFFDDVRITGVENELEDADRLLVAASAVIPLFGFPGWRYRNLNEVLLYEKSFNHDYQTEGEERNILGMVGSGAMQRMMILSRPALRAGFEYHQSKGNVGIHEFVHLLDKADGAIDGIPEVLLEQPYVLPWLKKMQEVIQEIKRDDSDINPYGATNKAEFFSVASEYFFQRPRLFRRKHPELYGLMKRMFRYED